MIAQESNDRLPLADYLTEVGDVSPESLSIEHETWADITWGLEGFIRWQFQQGFAVSSVNVRLSTVKAYAKLVVKAGRWTKQSIL